MSSGASSSETPGPSGLRRYAIRLESLAVLAILVVAVVTISCRILVHARLGGVTGDLLGAIVEINETLVLATFTLAAG